MNFDELTLSELKEIAKERGIKNISKHSKSELIELLSCENNEFDLSVSDTNESNNINDSRYKLTNEGDQIT